MSRRRDPWTEQALRIATLAYVLFLLWTFAGKPNVRTKLDHVARRTLRGVAQRADAAATRIGDRMIDRHNNVTS